MEEPLKCYKCGTIYEDAFAGFYWESRRGAFRRPCKKCISEYNLRPDQNSRRKRTAMEYYYLKVKFDRSLISQFHDLRISTPSPLKREKQNGEKE